MRWLYPAGGIFFRSDLYYGCAVPVCARLGAALLLAQFGAGPMSIGQKSRSRRRGPTDG